MFDFKIKKHFYAFILQSLLAAALVFGILFLVEMISNMVVIASLGASVFIAFTTPHSEQSSPKCFIGGYAVGALCGVAMNYAGVLMLKYGIRILEHSPHILTCAVAVGLAMFVMSAVNCEHPPAAALAMGLAIDGEMFTTVFVALLSISLVSLIKFLLKRLLKDLI